MYRRIYNVGSAELPPVVVEADAEEHFPSQLSRLGKRKMEYLVRGVAQLRRGQRVLELFGGTNLGTVLIAQQLGKTADLTTIDLHYPPQPVAWHYVVQENFAALAAYYGMKQYATPVALGMDARSLSFEPNGFDMVIAADPPRTASNRFGDPEKTAGNECQLTPDEQRQLFAKTSREVYRVLRAGGTFVTTVPRSWLGDMPFSDVQTRQGMGRLQFAPCDDPVLYVLAKK